MEMLIPIPETDLPELKESYKVNWPLHITTTSTIQLFIDRLANYPEWKTKAQFLSYGKDWKSTGTFIMINENRIFFNTLESFPFSAALKALINVKFEDEMIFVNIRDSLRSVIFDVVRIQHLEVVSDIGTKCFRLAKEDLLKLTVEEVFYRDAIGNDLELKPVTIDNIKKINIAWPGKFNNSEKFIEDAVEFNPSMGMYNKYGELVSWNMRIDNGSMGIGQVDSNFEGNMYGHLSILALAVKIAKDFDTDVHFEIVHGNSGAEESARRSGLEMIDTQSWIAVKKRKKREVAPLWGHL